MIYCLNCGKGIPDQSKFCTFCGTATAQIDPQNPNVASQGVGGNTPVVTPQSTYAPQPVTPPPPQYSNPDPPVNPVVSQYTNPNPPQYVNPQPVSQPYTHVTPNTGVVKNEFYKNIGFWGAVLLVVGFFLPYVSAVEASFYYLVTEFGADQPGVYLYLIFPVCGALLILQSFTGIFPKAVVVILKLLPLLFFGLLILGGAKSGTDLSYMGNDMESILSNIGVGLYMTVIGVILVLFYRTTKR